MRWQLADMFRAAAAIAASPATAQGLDLGPAGTINGTAGLLSDYVFRGASQTRGGQRSRAAWNGPRRSAR